MPYNTVSIRELLRETLSDEDLMIFCYDYFRPVYEKCSASIGRLTKIQLLIEYCESYEEFDKLLALIKQKNPRRYSKFASKIKESSQTQNLGISPDKAKLEIILKGNLSEFSFELQDAAVGALAGVLNIPREYINVLTIQAGSIIIQLELPINAAKRLIDLYEGKKAVIQDLGIQKITIISRQLFQHFDSAMIGKIEKALQYAQEPERVTFDEFRVTFNGDYKQHKISYYGGHWQCDCHFFQTRGVCSHVMTLERLLIGSVKPAEAIPMPA